MSLASRPSRALAPLAVLAIAAALASGRPAAALGMSPDPVVWSFASGANSIQLSHDLVSVATGLPAGGVVLTGAVGANDVTLVFQAHVELTGGARVTALAVVGPATANVTAAGWIPGSEPDALTDFVNAGTIPPNVGSVGFVNADFPDGATSDLFFVSFDHLAPGDVLRFQPFNNQIFFDVSVPATLVPEPASAGLLFVGLALLARRRAVQRR